MRLLMVNPTPEMIVGEMKKDEIKIIDELDKAIDEKPQSGRTGNILLLLAMIFLKKIRHYFKQRLLVQ